MGFEIRQGAIGLGEAVEITFEAPTGVDLTAVARTVQCSLVNGSNVTPQALTPWTEVSCTALELVARFVPTGVEFVHLGPAKLLPDLLLGGNRYRYASLEGAVIRR